MSCHADRQKYERNLCPQHEMSSWAKSTWILGPRAPLANVDGNILFGKLARNPKLDTFALSSRFSIRELAVAVISSSFTVIWAAECSSVRSWPHPVASVTPAWLSQLAHAIP